ncbi:Uncharacterised protein [Bordetella pertussis]|nr:Uncharacterised protein [Bordetella pertussis]
MTSGTYRSSCLTLSNTSPDLAERRISRNTSSVLPSAAGLMRAW